MMSAMPVGLVLAEVGQNVGQAVVQNVGEGRIQGGWGYIWSSYAIAWGSLALYALSLWLRRPGKAPNEFMTEPPNGSSEGAP